MLTTLLLMAAAAAAAMLVWWLAQRRGPEAGDGEPVAGHVPHRVHRGDLASPEARWAIVVFSSTTCMSCAGVIRELAPYESPDLVFIDIALERKPELHARYRIDSVPTTVLLDEQGAVTASWLGPLGSGDHQNLHRLIAES